MFHRVSRQESSIKLNELYGQIAELKGQVIAQGNSESKTLLEKTSLHKQIESLNDTVGKYAKKIEAVEADNRRLMQV